MYKICRFLSLKFQLPITFFLLADLHDIDGGYKQSV